MQIPAANLDQKFWLKPNSITIWFEISNQIDLIADSYPKAYLDQECSRTGIRSDKWLYHSRSISKALARPSLTDGSEKKSMHVLVLNRLLVKWQILSNNYSTVDVLKT